LFSAVHTGRLQRRGIAGGISERDMASGTGIGPVSGWHLKEANALERRQGWSGGGGELAASVEGLNHRNHGVLPPKAVRAVSADQTPLPQPV